MNNNHEWLKAKEIIVRLDLLEEELRQIDAALFVAVMRGEARTRSEAIERIYNELATAGESTNVSKQ